MHLHLIVGRSPWTAADALVGLSRLSKALVLRTKERVWSRGTGGRGRDSGCPRPSAQTRAGATNAHGSCLGYGRLASKRTLAASRTRASPCDPQIRHGVRYGLGSGVFSLACSLPSTTSAGNLSLLFGCFASTTPKYDSPLPCMRSEEHTSELQSLR